MASRTVTNAVDRRVGETVVLMPVSECTSLSKVGVGKIMQEGGVMDGIDIHEVENLEIKIIEARIRGIRSRISYIPLKAQ